MHAKVVVIFTVQFRKLFTGDLRSSLFQKFASTLRISIRNSQSNGKLWNELGNFALNFVGMWRSNFTVALGCCFEMSAFTELGKAIPSFVQQKITESWLEWKGPSQIGREQTKPLPRLLILSFAEGISKTTNEELSLGQRVLNDLNNYMECCKTTNPSIYSSEIQNKLR